LDRFTVLLFTITGRQRTTLNHAMHQIRHMHRMLSTPALNYQYLIFLQTPSCTCCWRTGVSIIDATHFLSV